MEQLSAELADTRESLREAQVAAAAAQSSYDAKVASSAQADTQLLALSAAQAKKVSYIEELDERLAVEQATREEQARLLAQLQQSLSERTAKEATSVQRAAEAEAHRGLERVERPAFVVLGAAAGDNGHARLCRARVSEPLERRGIHTAALSARDYA